MTARGSAQPGVKQHSLSLFAAALVLYVNGAGRYRQRAYVHFRQDNDCLLCWAADHLFSCLQPHYMSPEILSCKQYGFKTDVWYVSLPCGPCQA